MKPIGALLGLLLAVPVLIPVAASAQQGQPLTYVQPLDEDAIRQVQRRLRETGAYNGRVDGIWGQDSQAALQQFQQTHGLQVTGQLNPATVATLGLTPAQLVATASTGEAGTASPDVLSASSVRNVQQRLQALGFYRGNVDGLWGPNTQSALQQFQQARGLQATGQLNPATLAALGFNPNNLTGGSR